MLNKDKGRYQPVLKAGRWCRNAPKVYINSRDNDNKPIIIPDPEADCIRRIFQGISDGREQVEIRSKLKKEGYFISKSCISELICNLIYIGKIRIPASQNEPEKGIGILSGIDRMYYKADLAAKKQILLRSSLKI